MPGLLGSPASTTDSIAAPPANFTSAGVTWMTPLGSGFGDWPTRPTPVPNTAARQASTRMALMAPILCGPGVPKRCLRSEVVNMAQLVVRQLEGDAAAKLTKRAKRHGRSMEDAYSVGQIGA